MPETHLSSDARHGQSDGASRPLFAPTPTPRASASTILAFLFVIALVFGGFYLMAHAFSGTEFGIWWFAAGVLADAFGFWFAFGILPSIDRRR